LINPNKIVAARVIGILETIEKQLAQGLEPTLAQKVGPYLAQQTLENLPESVRTFTYSAQYNEISATRQTGTETWDGKTSMEWAKSVLSAEPQSEIGRNR